MFAREVIISFIGLEGGKKLKLFFIFLKAVAVAKMLLKLPQLGLVGLNGSYLLF